MPDTGEEWGQQPQGREGSVLGHRVLNSLCAPASLGTHWGTFPGSGTCSSDALGGVLGSRVGREKLSKWDPQDRDGPGLPSPAPDLPRGPGSQ